MKILYFDTSSINHLYDDYKSNEIIYRLKKNDIKVYLSIFNVAELASTADRKRRIKLINYAQQLSKYYRPLAIPGELLKRSLVAICTNKSTMNNSIGKEWESVWVALNEPDLIDDEYYTEICGWKKQQEAWYQNMHDNGRANMQKVLSELPRSKQKEITSNYSRIINYYSQQKVLLSDFISSIDIIKEIDLNIDNMTQIIIKHSEHWRFFLAGMIYGLYVRSIQKQNYSKKNNPGSIDTQQAIYLAVSDIFVTADKNQYKMMKLLVPFGNKKRLVLDYSRFCKWIING